MIKKRQGLANVLWLCFCLFLLIFSMGVSWQINKSVNFFYGFWYSQLNIAQTIKTYAPQNTHGKQDFANTLKEQHLLSFNEIVNEIHNSGQGLQLLYYRNSHQQAKSLLTPAEVLHLQDVSQLINKLGYFLAIDFLLLLVVSSVIFKAKYSVPKRKEQYLAIMIPSLLLVAGFSTLGFTEIFYYLHTIVFPDNHQWFFYYQESLMSTLMKAPDLFAAIGISLSSISIIVYIIIYRYLAKLLFKG